MGATGPNGLAIGPDNRLYVCEWFNSRFSTYDLATNKPDGNWAGTDKFQKIFSNPHSIAINPADPSQVFVTDLRRGLCVASVSGTGVSANGHRWKSWSVQAIPIDRMRSGTGVAVGTNAVYFAEGSVVRVLSMKGKVVATMQATTR
jgi:hypothetical protein